MGSERCLSRGTAPRFSSKIFIYKEDFIVRSRPPRPPQLSSPPYWCQDGNHNYRDHYSGDSEYDEDYESSGHPKGDFTKELTIKELADAVPSVPWKDFLEAALSHKAGFKVKPTDSVLVPDIDLMKRLGDMLEILTPRDRANLLIWRMFIRFVNDFMKTGSEQNELQQDPFAQRCKLPTQSLRRENCICQVNTLFPEAHNDLLIGE